MNDTLAQIGHFYLSWTVARQPRGAETVRVAIARFMEPDAQAS
jgi:hypothetical protein